MRPRPQPPAGRFHPNLILEVKKPRGLAASACPPRRTLMRDELAFGTGSECAGRADRT